MIKFLQMGIKGKSQWLVTLTLILLLFFASPVAFGGCETTSDISEEIGVVVSIMPQADFVESVGGEKVKVTVMVPQNADPHTYEPKPGQMKALSTAKMYAKVGSGIEFELIWMDKLVKTNQDMLVVDCAKDVQLIELADEDGHEDEAHGNIDPHIWASPLNAKVMVQNICEGLIHIDPGNTTYYKENRDTYLQSLAQLDEDIRDGLSGVRNRKFLVYHPAFGYFAHQYDLTMMAIEEQGKEPTAAGIAHLIQQAKKDDIKVVFASPQFNPQSAEVIANAIGGRVVFVDVLAKDYIANMRFLLGELVQAME